MMMILIHPRSRRFVATDWPVNIALLHHFAASRVLCWDSFYWGGFDAGYGAETPRGETRGMNTRAGGRYYMYQCARVHPHRYLV